MLIDIDDMRAILRVSDTAPNNPLFVTYVEAAGPVIEFFAGPVDETETTKTFDGGRGCVVLPGAGLTVTAVTVNGTALATTEYTHDVATGIVWSGGQNLATSFLPGRQNVTVTYTAGVPTPPANLRMAAMELVKHWWQHGQQPNRPGPQGPDGMVNTPLGIMVPGFVAQLCAPSDRGPGI